MSTLIRKTWRKPNRCPACHSRGMAVMDNPPGWQCAECGQIIHKAVPPEPYTSQLPESAEQAPQPPAPPKLPKPPKQPKLSKPQAPAPRAPDRAPSSFTVVEILEIGNSALSQTQWLIARTADGQAVIFWARADNHANFDAIRHHSPPFSVACETYATGKFGANWAVGADTALRIR